MLLSNLSEVSTCAPVTCEFKASGRVYICFCIPRFILLPKVHQIDVNSLVLHHLLMWKCKDLPLMKNNVDVAVGCLSPLT